MRRRAAFLLALSACPAAVVAQTPAGPEFRANATTTDTQRNGSVASDGAGNFVVTWASIQDGSSYGVFGRRFDAAGLPRGAEFRANTFTTLAQTLPSVASDAAGNFVVTWEGEYQDGSTRGVFAQRYDAAGLARGAEFRVNTFTTGYQRLPVVAAGAAGSFVVVWQSTNQDGFGDGVFAQLYDAAGAPRGSEFRVNTYTTGPQRSPMVASDAAGNLVVAWSSPQDGSVYGIFAQRYDAAGLPRGAEFQVNTYTSGIQSLAAVASDAAGNFVVTWTSPQDGSGYGVFGQRYDAAGAPRGGEFRINTYSFGNQRRSAVASDAAGNFVVTWESNGQDGSLYGVFGQRYDAAGAARGSEFRVNTYTPSAQARPAVAADRVGNLVVVWESAYQDGSSSGVFGQRFGGLHPAALQADPLAGASSDGNGVLEPGETVTVRPSWRNLNGSELFFGGRASAFGGPSGPTYTIADADAVYGLADGATGPCKGCYALGVSNPVSRPGLHWDGAFTETLLPERLHGQATRWTVHVGNSFSDAPRTNPFYRFIETLLHHGVTGGCSATTYCPSSSTAREQMAVFVLVAKEGTGYAPPACANPVFNDVPPSSPFCRWIEELFRRGVVSGCGGGNYCPAAAVTREQMAIFVLRTLDPALNPPACTTPVFADVPASSPFCRWIEELARRGVVTGCGGGNYCPSQPVTREQMGVFISATFGLALYGP